MSAMISKLSRPPALLDHRREIDILGLLAWTYREQRADVVIRQGQGLAAQEAALDGVVRQASSTCGAAEMAAIGELGYRIAGTASAGHLHEDAEAVHRAVVARRDAWLVAKVIEHGRLGEVPDWMPGAVPQYRRVLNARGQQAMIFEASDRARNYGACRIEWVQSGARIEMARTEYVLWWHAVADVANRMSKPGMLAAHRLRPFDLEKMPWNRVSSAPKIDITHLH